MAVRDCRWGDGPGGTKSDRDIFEVFEEAEQKKKDELRRRKWEEELNTVL